MLLCNYVLFCCYVNITALSRLRCTGPGSLFTREQQNRALPICANCGALPTFARSVATLLTASLARASLHCTFLILTFYIFVNFKVWTFINNSKVRRFINNSKVWNLLIRILDNTNVRRFINISKVQIFINCSKVQIFINCSKSRRCVNNS